MMKKNTDVLIIGAGLSGLMAAAKAADSGKKVLLVAKGMGALGLSSGCIDLWGYSLDHPEEICQDPVQEIIKMVAAQKDHPYAKVWDVLEESLSFFQQICSQNGLAYEVAEKGNWLLPTALGTVRPTYLAPAGMAARELPRAKNILVMGFQGLKDFYPEVLTTNLKNNMNLPADCQLTTLMLDLGKIELSPNNLAYLLEKDEVLQRLVSQIKPHLAEEMVILMPPVLGERGHTKVLLNLVESLGVQVYEVTNIPPSLPGQRLQQALLHHLKKQSVEIILGCTVIGTTVLGEHCTEVLAEGSGKNLTIAAKSIILATGSFLGGGMEAQPGKVIETVFHLPIKVLDEKWSAKEFLSLEGHPFSKFGIEVNNHLQPVNSQGEVVIKNIRVIGANLAGANYPIEKCGNGVALATGYKAGKLVGEV
ncbi:glycerol 3-phosphate dehydrogenase (quinone) subunit B [Desulforamulus reducens MI-1]|uniref:Glycerol 3-phosphate dehydrogenase (Quinone) subunit B n=1 Tax=Desulforamulus reducens (strain ATCC BAA-1160 / DSM 100696 / MI-1) TaxID=349161 RepID=A4J8E4_DESRM|nr:anaerobic glycerol-3-phosphate dehydrogenase subunit GlpB [Desulforamulus reducens]ABO51347.1 glycerol 3-phosphate dehydrogenase (quinone) subunit B [Desulforamulus reducens MI-1]